MAALRSLAMTAALLLSSCATEVSRSYCSCEIVAGPESCRIEHEEQEFTKRPMLDKIGDALGSLLGLVGL